MPTLKTEGLIGGYQFYDGQMDDHELGLWVANQARKSGASLYENVHIRAVTPQGVITELSGKTTCYDRVINVSGPWAEKLAIQSGCQLPYKLDPVRGSHIVVERHCQQALILEVANEARIFFVLPWKGKTLIGTTEERHKLTDPIECSNDEIQYLLKAYNYYISEKIKESDISERFAGLRPLIKPKSHKEQHPSKATREYIIHKQHRFITVLGGKWTTALALSRQVAKAL